MEDWNKANYNRNFASGKELDGMSPVGINDVVKAAAGLIAGMIAAAVLLVAVYCLTLA